MAVWMQKFPTCNIEWVFAGNREENYERKKSQYGSFIGRIYSGCQKNVPIAERFFATTLMPPSFFRNINMTSGINIIVYRLPDRQLINF
jgi:hypothetical protein